MWFLDARHNWRDHRLCGARFDQPALSDQLSSRSLDSRAVAEGKCGAGRRIQIRRRTRPGKTGAGIGKTKTQTGGASRARGKNRENRQRPGGRWVARAGTDRARLERATTKRPAAATNPLCRQKHRRKLNRSPNRWELAKSFLPVKSDRRQRMKFWAANLLSRKNLTKPKRRKWKRLPLKMPSRPSPPSQSRSRSSSSRTVP